MTDEPKKKRGRPPKSETLGPMTAAERQRERKRWLQKCERMIEGIAYIDIEEHPWATEMSVYDWARSFLVDNGRLKT